VKGIAGAVKGIAGAVKDIAGATGPCPVWAFARHALGFRRDMRSVRCGVYLGSDRPSDGCMAA
jgi:hypothetical protein